MGQPGRTSSPPSRNGHFARDGNTTSPAIARQPQATSSLGHRPRHPPQPPRRPAMLSFESAGRGAQPQRTSPAESFRACTPLDRQRRPTKQEGCAEQMAGPDGEAGDRGYALPGADGLWLRRVMPEVLRYAETFRAYVTKNYRITHPDHPGNPRPSSSATLSTHQPREPRRDGRTALKVDRPAHLEHPSTTFGPRGWLSRAQRRTELCGGRLADWPGDLLPMDRRRSADGVLLGLTWWRRRIGRSGGVC